MTDAELHALEEQVRRGIEPSDFRSPGLTAHEALDAIVAEVRRLRVIEAAQRLAATTGVQEALDLHDMLKTRGMVLLAAERLAEEALRVDGEIYGWGEPHEGCSDQPFFDAIAAYRKAKGP